MINRTLLFSALLAVFLCIGCAEKTTAAVVSPDTAVSVDETVLAGESDPTLWIEQEYERKIQVLHNSFYFVKGESITRKIERFGIPFTSKVEEQRTPYEPNDVYGRLIYSEYADFAIRYFVPDDPEQEEILLFLDIFGNNPLLDTDFTIGMSRGEVIETFALEPDFESENDMEYEIGLGSPDGKILFSMQDGLVYRMTLTAYMYY